MQAYLITEKPVRIISAYVHADNNMNHCTYSKKITKLQKNTVSMLDETRLLDRLCVGYTKPRFRISKFLDVQITINASFLKKPDRWKCDEFFENILTSVVDGYHKELSRMHKSIACVHLPRFLKDNYNVSMLWILVLSNGRYVNSFRPYTIGTMVNIGKTITDGSYYDQWPSYVSLPFRVMHCIKVDFKNLREIDVYLPPKTTKPYYSIYQNYPIPFDIKFYRDTKDHNEVLSTMPHSSYYPCTDATEYEYTDMSRGEHDNDNNNGGDSDDNNGGDSDDDDDDNNIIEYGNAKMFDSSHLKKIYFEKLDQFPYKFINETFDMKYYRFDTNDTLYVVISGVALTQAKIRERLTNRVEFIDERDITLILL